MFAAKVRRLHLVEADAPNRSWLKNIARFSDIGRTTERDPLVLRTVNTGGLMTMIAKVQSARAQSEEDHRRLVELYGTVPW
jgi:hypothetical protein